MGRECLRDLVDRAQPSLVSRLGLKDDRQAWTDWSARAGWPGTILRTAAQELVDELERPGALDAPPPHREDRLRGYRERLDDLVEARVREYRRRLVDATLSETAEAIAAYGLPYAAEVLSRVDALIAEAAHDADVEVRQKCWGSSPARRADGIGESLRRAAQDDLRRAFACRAVDIWDEYRQGLLRRLRDEVEERRIALLYAPRCYGPPRVPRRYARQYEWDLPVAINPHEMVSLRASEEAAARLVTTGQWGVGDDAASPGGQIVTIEHGDPEAVSLRPMPAAIRLGVSEEELLARARLFVTRCAEETGPAGVFRDESERVAR